MMKACELCKSEPARICCESDQASLCWGCDSKVHGANFLVAKHSRCLLCHVCSSPTPWTASGPKFSPTVSVCQICLQNYGSRTTTTTTPDQNLQQEQDQFDEYSEIDEDEDDVDDDDDDDDDDDGDGDDDVEEEEGENQVVPWTLSPPAATSSSCSDDNGESLSSAGRGGASPLKRIRGNAGLESDDEIGCCSSQIGSGSLTGNEEGSSVGLMRPLKQPRTSELLNQLQKLEEDGETESRSAAAVCTVGRLQRRVVNGEDEATSFVLGLCKLSRDRGR